jgi:hypothetical protein
MELSSNDAKKAMTWRSFLLILAVLVGGCSGDITSAGPLSRTEALERSQSDLPLPDIATAVYFQNITHGSQDHDLFVRFAGNVKDIRSFVAAFFKKQQEYRLKMGRSPLKAPIVDEIAGDPIKRPWIGPFGLHPTLPEWWQPEKIQRGYYIGNCSSDSVNEHFWIDEEQGLAFYYGHH